MPVEFTHLGMDVFSSSYGFATLALRPRSMPSPPPSLLALPTPPAQAGIGDGDQELLESVRLDDVPD